MAAIDPIDAPLHRWIAGHGYVFALTGAGCSTASGILDYRDDRGDWKRRRPVMQETMTAGKAGGCRVGAGAGGGRRD